MNWRVDGAANVETVEVDGTQLWRVELLASALKDITIGICLLWHDLVSSLELVDVRGNPSVRILLGKTPGSYPATIVRERERAVLTLSPTEFEAWMFFFLRTMRDGLAEVGHLDLEADSRAPGQRPASVMIKFPHSAPPLSADEVRRRLGLPP